MKKYPYIDCTDPKRKKVHLSEDLYIETDGKEYHMLVEHSPSMAGKMSILKFSWEYFNHPNEKVMRNEFGNITLVSCGNGSISLPQSFGFDSFGDDGSSKKIWISELFDYYNRFRKLKKILRLD